MYSVRNTAAKICSKVSSVVKCNVEVSRVILVSSTAGKKSLLSFILYDSLYESIIATVVDINVAFRAIAKQLANTKLNDVSEMLWFYGLNWFKKITTISYIVNVA